STGATSAVVVVAVEDLLRLATAVAAGLGGGGDGPVEGVLGVLFRPDGVVHVEPHEAEEFVGQVGGEGGHRHEHDPGDRVRDRGQVPVDGCGDLGDRD